MKKTAILLMILTIVSKFVGFGREITLSYFYGASAISDAYLISLTIPQTIFAFIGAAIATCFVPMYSGIKKNQGPRQANRFTSNLTNITLVLCTGFFIFGMIFTGPVVRMFASGFEGDTLALAVRFSRVTLFGIYFSGLTYVFTAYLQVNNNFGIPALTGFPFNFAIIVSIVLSSALDTMYLAYGVVLAMILQLLLLVPFVRDIGYKHKFNLNIKDENIKKILYLATPVILGSSVNQINKLVDRTLASRLAVGGISALNYASRLNGFVFGIFVVSISTAMYPMISKMAAENNMDGLKKSLGEAISGTNLLVVPAAVGSMLFAQPIVELLFGRGSFDGQALKMTSTALFFYSIGMIGYGLREVLTRAFYSLQDTKTPKINAAISVVVNIILNFVLSAFLGIGGLALATSISALFCTGLLFVSLRKKVGYLGLRNIGESFVKICIASGVMGLVARVVYGILNDFSASVALVAAIGVGAVVYFVLVFILRIDAVESITSGVKRRLRAR